MMNMMNSKTILFFFFTIGFVTACFEYCPEECSVSGCNVWFCESELDCLCDDCYWFNEQLSLADVKRVKKDVLKSKLKLK
uniref:Uncharacterized protein n=1 Tax=Caenorhabditis tropicalis TaxID=1561998 RepID=A0A1I7UKF5_9PELO